MPLTEDAMIDKTDEHFILIPPHISINYFQVRLKFYRAEHIPNFDDHVGGGDTDLYIQCKYLGQKLKTKV